MLTDKASTGTQDELTLKPEPQVMLCDAPDFYCSVKSALYAIWEQQGLQSRIKPNPPWKDTVGGGALQSSPEPENSWP